MTPEQIRQAVISHNPSYKAHKRQVAALTKQGRVREAKDLQQEYSDRLNGWKLILRRAYMRNNLKK